jgi:hypothetical protein
VKDAKTSKEDFKVLIVIAPLSFFNRHFIKPIAKITTPSDYVCSVALLRCRNCNFPATCLRRVIVLFRSQRRSNHGQHGGACLHGEIAHTLLPPRRLAPITRQKLSISARYVRAWLVLCSKDLAATKDIRTSTTVLRRNRHQLLYMKAG